MNLPLQNQIISRSSSSSMEVVVEFELVVLYKDTSSTTNPPSRSPAVVLSNDEKIRVSGMIALLGYCSCLPFDMKVFKLPSS
mmetsp:Transcript_17507/g.24337  ORF Transcript_17507/g.24337 Transcript_17507/m.24337 type:complete len:82 (-) Transcript_17507:400-645(-)